MNKYFKEKLEERLRALSDELDAIRYEKANMRSSRLVIQCVDILIQALKYNLKELPEYTDERLVKNKIKIYSETI